MKNLILIALFLSAFPAQARFWPKGHEPKIKIHPESATGLSQQQFDDLLNRIAKTFQPIYAAKGKSLQINHLWNDETINSDARWEGNTCVINAYGGLARTPWMTYNAYLMVDTHENGHCLGGAPYFSNDPTMSVEGQADTYSVDGARIMGLNDIDIQAAAKVLSDGLAQLGGESLTSWPGPMLPAVSTLYEDHPAAQCRRDTYMFRDLKVQRPDCWYPDRMGGISTGVIPGGQPQPAPAPTPMPQPEPQPVPMPQPGPVPRPCGCQPPPMPMPYPGPMPGPMPYPGPWPFPPGFTYTITVHKLGN